MSIADLFYVIGQLGHLSDPDCHRHERRIGTAKKRNHHGGVCLTHHIVLAIPLGLDIWRLHVFGPH